MANIHEESGRVPGRGAYTNCQVRIEEFAREVFAAVMRSGPVIRREDVKKVVFRDP